MTGLKKHNTITRLRVTPTITTDAYTQYDVVGGAMTLNVGGGGTIRHIKIQDDDDQKEPYKLYFFAADPDIANDAAFAPTDAELDDLLATVEITADDYDEWGGANTVAFKYNANVDIPDGISTVILYAVAQDTPDYGATNALTFEVTYWTNKAG